MYVGTFINTDKEELEGYEGITYWVPRNEHEENYLELRNNPSRPKYVVLVDPETTHVTGCAPEGNFVFYVPIKVYFMDDVPEDGIENPGFYQYDEEHGFRPRVDVRAWKYNQGLDAREDRMEAMMEGDREKLRVIKDWLETADAYVGNGYEPPLPIRPY
ncbi:hypothetical protein pEaSNUABM57_00009 [Erwinia phage pEa_SNUABM_57]|uniref:Uncharacterized protein n=1 Tax=Erwinia phage pEa_SNUABM_57 TaxID=2996118 RepID=A0A9E8YUL5_9CAUD|nr:hypothetical protein pEaSNUABM57_00009 [Erwinia phage pEa_SNUABM_57]